MTVLYGLNSNRSRYQIIADYAATHDLTAQQVDALVRQLPDYGVKSMLGASLAVTKPANVIRLSDRRDLLRNNRVAIGEWTADRDGAA